MIKKRIIFRIFPFNQLSFPLLLNVWEKNNLDEFFKIEIVRDLDELGELSEDDIILYSFMTHHLPIVEKEIEKMKKYGVKVAAGGPHVTGDLYLAKKIGFDYIFIGYGEKTFIKFGMDLIEGKSNEFPIIYESSNDEEFDNYLPISKYVKTVPPLEIMRGCHWNCSYCQTGKFKVKYRSIESIKKYLNFLNEKKYGRVNFISPSSLEFGSVKPGVINFKRVEEFLKLTKEYDFNFVEYGVFPSEIRPETVSDNMIKLLSKYVSNKKLTIGAQSGLNSRLRSIHRGHTIQNVEKSIKIINKYDFIAIVDFIIAYPDETYEEREETIKFVLSLLKNYRVRVQFHHFFPISGSDLSKRFPSYLTEEEKNKFLKLNIDGGSTVSWLIGEKVTKDFFTWLKNYSPEYFSEYR